MNKLMNGANTIYFTYTFVNLQPPQIEIVANPYSLRLLKIV